MPPATYFRLYMCTQIICMYYIVKVPAACLPELLYSKKTCVTDVVTCVTFVTVVTCVTVEKKFYHLQC